MTKTIKTLASALAIILLFSLLAPLTLLANEISVFIDNQQVHFADQNPVIVDERTLVPIRDVFEILGFYPSFDSGTRTVTLAGSSQSIYSGYEFRIIIGNYYFELNGQTFPLDVPAQIINDRTMLPLRPLLEQIGINVDWVSATRTVIIETPLLPQLPLAGISHEQLRDMLIGTWVMQESEIPEGHFLSSFTLHAEGDNLFGYGTYTTDTSEGRLSWLINVYMNLVVGFSDHPTMDFHYFGIADLTADSITLTYSTWERHIEGLPPFYRTFVMN